MNSKSAALLRYTESAAKNIIKRPRLTFYPWQGRVSIPKGKKLLKHQEVALKFAMTRNNSYLALDPGLGKTVVAAAFLNTHAKEREVFCIYICPPFLVATVQAELREWLNPGIARLVFPDSLLTKDHALAEIEKLIARKEGLCILIIDEAHRYKNENAKRTPALLGEFGLAEISERELYLSGTPTPNARPMELYPLLKHAAPELIDFKSARAFGMRYCGPTKKYYGRNKFAYEFKGASNVKEFKKRLGKFMIRIMKEEVSDLPPKIESALLINGGLSREMRSLDETLKKSYSAEDLMRASIHLKRGGRAGEEEKMPIATYRRLLGEEKVKGAIEAIEGILEGGEESLIVFAIHVKVIERLAHHFRKLDPVVITGKVKASERHEKVEKFKKDKTRRLFLGNIQAAGVGFTVTKCTRVLMVEWDWVPGNNEQAIDRVHRIGQTKSVYVQYLVFDNSLDMAVLKTILRKKSINKSMQI